MAKYNSKIYRRYTMRGAMRVAMDRRLALAMMFLEDKALLEGITAAMETNALWGVSGANDVAIVPFVYPRQQRLKRQR